MILRLQIQKTALIVLSLLFTISVAQFANTNSVYAWQPQTDQHGIGHSISPGSLHGAGSFAAGEQMTHSAEHLVLCAKLCATNTAAESRYIQKNQNKTTNVSKVKALAKLTKDRTSAKAPLCFDKNTVDSFYKVTLKRPLHKLYCVFRN